MSFQAPLVAMLLTCNAFASVAFAGVWLRRISAEIPLATFDHACELTGECEGLSLLQHRAADAPYQAPYKIDVTGPDSVILDDLAERWKDAITPQSGWYSEKNRKNWTSWGPRPPPYSEWQGPSDSSLRRQRLLGFARRFIGTVYQHHHNPFWNPYDHGFTSDPAGGKDLYWPWSPVTIGRGTAGIDCSDFSAYIYNLALGIQMTTNVADQANNSTGIHTSSGTQIIPLVMEVPNVAGTTRSNKPGDLADFIKGFLPGDLLYVRNLKGGDIADRKVGEVSHVVIWLGEFGRMADGSVSPQPLVLSSHDNTPPINSTRGLPPPGVHILPFDADNWFYKGFVRALRIL